MIPFGIQNATWYSLVEGTTIDFNLDGTADSWGVVLFGNDVSSPSQEEHLSAGYLGKSAFGDATHPTVSAAVAGEQ